MSEIKEFLERIFDVQDGKYICISTKNRIDGTWRDRFFTSTLKATGYAEAQAKRGKIDVYFCPTKLSEARRLKQNVCSSKFLYSDLDEADPKEVGDDLCPTLAWESSPGRYQSLWELDEPASPDGIEAYNKGLAETLGADLGGWDLSQVLRVPGTRNWKYDTGPSVVMLWDKNTTRPIGDYPRGSVGSRDSLPLSKSTPVLQKLLRKYRSRIPNRSLRLLTARKAEEGKRSDVLWSLSHTLIEAGIPEDAVFELVRASAWNKFRGRRDEEERLRFQISDALEKVDASDEEEVEERLQRERTMTSFLDLLDDPIPKEEWLVDGFWGRGSKGLIVAPPKSFKSMLVMDLAISIASGEPFLNKFQPAISGPVIMIQNENRRIVMKDRAEKFSAQKNLGATISNGDDGFRYLEPHSVPCHLHFYDQQFSFDDVGDCEFIEDILKQAKPLMVIFDPFLSMFSGNSSSEEEVKKALTWLNYINNEYETAVILVHHMNKSREATGADRIFGSVAFNAWYDDAWFLNVEQTTVVEEGEGEAVISIDKSFRSVGGYAPTWVALRQGKMWTQHLDVKVLDKGAIEEIKKKPKIKVI